MTETTAAPSAATPSTAALTAAAQMRSGATAIRSATRDEIEQRHAERGIVAAALLAAAIARASENRMAATGITTWDRAIEEQRATAARRWLRQYGRELTLAIDADDQTIDLILALTGANR